MSPPAGVVIRGWTLYAHPLFLDQVEVLASQVERFRKKDPEGYRSKNATKRLAAVTRLAFDTIPADPARPEYRLGHTLGAAHAHWFRAKFFQQYRLFFRCHAQARLLVYAWVNDDSTLRAYERDDDAYAVFQKMLRRGHPPDDWDELLSEAKAEQGRLHALARGTR